MRHDKCCNKELTEDRSECNGNASKCFQECKRTNPGSTCPSPHGWPDRLRAAALGGSASAHHDLDAVMALFASAERLSERYRGVYAVTTFLDTLRDQSIASESITESSHARVEQESMVQIMTVHRAKGLEWKRVWITGLEEGRWPNVQPRGSLLGVEELASADQVAPDLMREERNLLFVAMTRAREQVTLLPVTRQTRERIDRAGSSPT